MDGPSQSFFARHEFLIRRLHSLSGLIPVGAYMTVHLVTNASVLNGPGTFQKNVYAIHSLGNALPLVEWTFIFIPIIFHAVVGLMIMAGMVPNTSNYPYAANRRYNWQRWTGFIALIFIAYHVFHMHGWFHFDAWMKNVAEPYGGARFRPFNAASTAGIALQSPFVLAFYVVGVLACVFHFANGLWTMGITWGVWISEGAQQRALKVCMAFGVVLSVISMGALYGMWKHGREAGLQKAVEVEDRLYKTKIESGDIEPNEHKRTSETRSDIETSNHSDGGAE